MSSSLQSAARRVRQSVSQISLIQWIFISLSAGYVIGLLAPAFAPVALAVAGVSALSGARSSASAARAAAAVAHAQATETRAKVIVLSMQPTYIYDETQGVS